MMPWRIRDFHEDELDAAVRLWDGPGGLVMRISLAPR